ncbi:MAG: SdpI family protein [Desulfosalsimonadaceae bacterium]
MTNQPFAVPALLLFVLAVPLLLGLIPRNRFYGVRTLKTLSDDDVWYRVNRLAAAVVMAASCVYGMVAILVPYDRMANDDFLVWGIHLAAFAVPIAIGLSLVIRYAKRL